MSDDDTIIIRRKAAKVIAAAKLPATFQRWQIVAIAVVAFLVGLWV